MLSSDLSGVIFCDVSVLDYQGYKKMVGIEEDLDKPIKYSKLQYKKQHRIIPNIYTLNITMNKKNVKQIFIG